jgi:hypothetical protein
MNVIIHEAMSAHVSLLNRAFGATTRKVTLDRYCRPQLTEAPLGRKMDDSIREKRKLHGGIYSSGARTRTPHLHHHHLRFEFSFHRALEKLIDFFLNQLSNLLLSALLAERARNILDIEEVGLYCRSS